MSSSMAVSSIHFVQMENSKKRKEREGKSREMYEKMFPELRKQREDKVRTCYLVVNVGD